jgi:hypothetical protein
MKKIVMEGKLDGSQDSYRRYLTKDQMSMQEMIARIKFKRTIRRIIKLINSK